MADHTTIPGTVIFDGTQARKGYALNKMCYSFNDAANRQAFLADEEAYCARYGLNPQQREAIRVAWYATAGSFEQASTGRGAQERVASSDNVWVAPEEAGAASSSSSAWFIIVCT